MKVDQNQRVCGGTPPPPFWTPNLFKKIRQITRELWDKLFFSWPNNMIAICAQWKSKKVPFTRRGGRRVFTVRMWSKICSSMKETSTLFTPKLYVSISYNIIINLKLKFNRLHCSIIMVNEKVFFQTQCIHGILYSCRVL